MTLKRFVKKALFGSKALAPPPPSAPAPDPDIEHERRKLDDAQKRIQAIQLRAKLRSRHSDLAT